MVANAKHHPSWVAIECLLQKARQAWQFLLHFWRNNWPCPAFFHHFLKSPPLPHMDSKFKKPLWESSSSGVLQPCCTDFRNAVVWLVEIEAYLSVPEGLATILLFKSLKDWFALNTKSFLEIGISKAMDSDSFLKEKPMECIAAPFACMSATFSKPPDLFWGWTRSWDGTNFNLYNILCSSKTLRTPSAFVVIGESTSITLSTSCFQLVHAMASMVDKPEVAPLCLWNCQQTCLCHVLVLLLLLLLLLLCTWLSIVSLAMCLVPTFYTKPSCRTLVWQIAKLLAQAPWVYSLGKLNCWAWKGYFFEPVMAFLCKASLQWLHTFCKQGSCSSLFISETPLAQNLQTNITFLENKKNIFYRLKNKEKPSSARKNILFLSFLVLCAATSAVLFWFVKSQNPSTCVPDSFS